ncbi:hypothetical protein STEG23_002679 [Scotinomys teguina]
MARKVGQGEEEEESRARQQGGTMEKGRCRDYRTHGVVPPTFKGSFCVLKDNSNYVSVSFQNYNKMPVIITLERRKGCSARSFGGSSRDFCVVDGLLPPPAAWAHRITTCFVSEYVVSFGEGSMRCLEEVGELRPLMLRDINEQCLLIPVILSSLLLLLVVVVYQRVPEDRPPQLSSRTMTVAVNTDDFFLLFP